MKIKTPLALIGTLLFQFAIANASETHSCCAANLPAAQFSGQSLYQTESAWTTDGDKTIKLRALAGKPQLVLMFYSRCTTACPLLENELRQIESALPPATRTKIGFTLISFDSERDTPKALAEYRKAWNLPDDWNLLSGKADDILELAALLGIQYKQITDGQFAHSNVTTLLNENGEIAFQQTGLNADPQEMVRQIEKMLK